MPRFQKGNTHGNRFKKGEVSNPNGRKVKVFKEHIKDLTDKGYKTPSRGEFYDIVGLLLSLTEEDLKAFAMDVNKPYSLRTIAIDLNDRHKRTRIVSDHRDWMFGKAVQPIEQEVKGARIITIGLDDRYKTNGETDNSMEDTKEQQG